MSNTVIALLFAIGFGGWVFAKINRSTGGNAKSAVIAAVGAGIVAFLVLFFLLGAVVPES